VEWRKEKRGYTEESVNLGDDSWAYLESEVKAIEIIFRKANILVEVYYQKEPALFFNEDAAKDLAKKIEQKI